MLHLTKTHNELKFIKLHCPVSVQAHENLLDLGMVFTAHRGEWIRYRLVKYILNLRISFRHNLSIVQMQIDVDMRKSTEDSNDDQLKHKLQSIKQEVRCDC